MEQKKVSILNVAVIVAALGYFVDIYDLLLFAIIRIPSLRALFPRGHCPALDYSTVSRVPDSWQKSAAAFEENFATPADRLQYNEQ